MSKHMLRLVLPTPNLDTFNKGIFHFTRLHMSQLFSGKVYILVALKNTTGI